LQTKESAFRGFYNNQIEIFKNVCSFYLDGLSTEQIAEVFRNIDSGMFTKEKSEYLQIVNAKVIEYKARLGKEKLRKFWNEKTGTASPYEWSQKYKTPILCMIDDNENIARKAFSIIGRINPDESDVRDAIAYLESATFYDALNSESKRDDAFKRKITKVYSTMLPDINEVKNCLISRISAEPYYWYQSNEVEKLIKEFAEAKYNAGGSDAALRKIEEMDADKLKLYLKQLIKDNMVVGIEIINDK
jgi:hypothetical protein